MEKCSLQNRHKEYTGPVVHVFNGEYNSDKVPPGTFCDCGNVVTHSYPNSEEQPTKLFNDSNRLQLLELLTAWQRSAAMNGDDAITVYQIETALNKMVMIEQTKARVNELVKKWTPSMADMPTLATLLESRKLLILPYITVFEGLLLNEMISHYEYEAIRIQQDEDDSTNARGKKCVELLKKLKKVLS